MQFIPNYLPYPSVRYPIYARNGMVCASSPQAAAAGLEAMKKGGQRHGRCRCHCRCPDCL